MPKEKRNYRMTIGVAHMVAEGVIHSAEMKPIGVVTNVPGKGEVIFNGISVSAKHKRIRVEDYICVKQYYSQYAYRCCYPAPISVIHRPECINLIFDVKAICIHTCRKLFSEIIQGIFLQCNSFDPISKAFGTRNFLANVI